jgi:hypothetical protein
MNADVLPCPVCWKTPESYPARRTSEKRGVTCAFLAGCKHADAIFGPAAIEQPKWPEAIARWNTEAERLLTAMSGRWTPVQLTNFRASLGFPAAAPVVARPVQPIVHDPNCDTLDQNPNGIMKPCNCGAIGRTG